MIHCGACGAEINARADYKGRRFMCPTCGKGVIYVADDEARRVALDRPSCETCKWSEWAEPEMFRVAAEKVRDMLYDRFGRGLVTKPPPDVVKPENIEGQCRRNPPTVFAEISSEEENEHLKEVKTEYVTRFPTVKARDWCGEWEPR
jgi:predicted RNA-binding Zn-ribbon protein involved in translation (DUF1610 family)